MEPKRTVTVVCPVHNEAENVEPLARRLREVARGLAGYRLDVLFVNDGSTDDTLSAILGLREKGWPIGFVDLSRNFGHQAAIDAGLRTAQGDLVITMDGDLQHPPEEIPRMLATSEKEGADVVQMVRRSPSRGKKGALSLTFYRTFSKLAHSQLTPNAADFRLLSRRVVDALLRIPEREKFWRGLIPTLGFRQVCLDYNEAERAAGTASYDVAASWRLAQKAVLDFSTVPLRLVFWGGLGLAVLSFAFGVGHVIVKLVAWHSVAPGFTDLIVATLFLSGTILAALGVLGRYLIMILEQLRGRPSFLVSEEVQGGAIDDDAGAE